MVKRPLTLSERGRPRAPFLTGGCESGDLFLFSRLEEELFICLLHPKPTAAPAPAMSIQPQPPSDLCVPEDTARAARAAFPRGNRYLQLRDQFGTLFEAADFVAFYSHRGQPTYSPWRLALVGSASSTWRISPQAGRRPRPPARIVADPFWTGSTHSALRSETRAPMPSVLCEFRGRLARAGAESLLLGRMLGRLEEAGLVKASCGAQSNAEGQREA